MLFDIDMQRAPIGLVKLVGDLRHADTLAPLDRLIKQLREDGCSAAALDCNQVKRASASGTVSFVDCLLHEHVIPVAATGVTKALEERLKKANVYDALPIFCDLEDALKTPDLRRCQMTATKAVVLWPNNPNAFGAIAKHVPSPLLDILGRPMLGRILDHFDRFGIRSVFATLGPDPTLSREFLDAENGLGPSVFCARRNLWKENGPVTGSAGALFELYEQHAAFNSDVVIQTGNFVSTADLPSLVRHHQTLQADFTLIAPNDPPNIMLGHRLSAPPNKHLLRDCGQLILHPRCFTMARPKPEDDVLRDWLPALIRAGAHVRCAPSDGYARTVRTAADHFAISKDILSAHITDLAPRAEARTQRLWAHPTAQIHPRAKIDGTTFVGAGAHIAAGVVLQDTVAIAPGARVGADCVLRDSIVLRDSEIAAREIFDRHIVGGGWSTSHALPETRIVLNPARPQTARIQDVPALLTASA